RVDEEQARFDKLLNMKGSENAYKLHRELGEIMTANVTVVRHNDKLLETDKKIVELMKRYQDIDMEDTSQWSNQA
ncbi:succinate dehydrogenase flavoprotein subunit, partial [Staphylococcus pseudintermedius]